MTGARPTPCCWIQRAGRRPSSALIASPQWSLAGEENNKKATEGSVDVNGIAAQVAVPSDNQCRHSQSNLCQREGISAWWLTVKITSIRAMTRVIRSANWSRCKRPGKLDVAVEEPNQLVSSAMTGYHRSHHYTADRSTWFYDNLKISCVSFVLRLTMRSIRSMAFEKSETWRIRCTHHQMADRRVLCAPMVGW